MQRALRIALTVVIALGTLAGTVVASPGPEPLGDDSWTDAVASRAPVVVSAPVAVLGGVLLAGFVFGTLALSFYTRRQDQRRVAAVGRSS